MADYTSLHLDSDEHVLLSVHRHWIVFIGSIISFIFFAGLPIVLYILAHVFSIPFITDISSGPIIKLISIFYMVWLLSFWLSFAITWTKYYLDVWYVTEKRIIDVDQKKIFHREVSNLRFDKIQDVTVEVQGFIATWFDFGNVKVQTAAEDSKDFYMTFVSRPNEVKRVIFMQHNVVGDKGDKVVDQGGNY
ncbi:MAG: PH domain-containing protein [Minisyncoccota bacterium]